MLDHVELYVRDLNVSAAFWTPFTRMLGYDADRWSHGINYRRGPQEPYLSLLQAPAEHHAAGYHRKRIGLNHLAFRVPSRTHVDRVRAWLGAEGHTLLYDDRYPFATAPGYYAVFCEDPDRIKVEVVTATATETAT